MVDPKKQMKRKVNGQNREGGIGKAAREGKMFVAGQVEEVAQAPPRKGGKEKKAKVKMTMNEKNKKNKKAKALREKNEKKLAGKESDDEPADKGEGESVDKKALAAEAVTVILEGLAKLEALHSTKAYIPREWATKFRQPLGSYKKFVSKRPEVFRVIEHDACNFTVVPANAPASSSSSSAKVVKAKAAGGGDVGGGLPKGDKPWEKELYKAWLCYCKMVERPKRSFAAFTGAIVDAPPAGQAGGASAAAAADTGVKKKKKR